MDTFSGGSRTSMCVWRGGGVVCVCVCVCVFCFVFFVVFFFWGGGGGGVICSLGYQRPLMKCWEGLVILIFFNLQCLDAFGSSDSST